MSAHHIIISNPFNDSSSEDDPTAVPSAPSALRAQLHHLLPRHTFFRARIHIHQIANIPLVSGEFGVKWKFKNVHTPSGTKQGGILGMVKSKSMKGKGKEVNEDDEDGDTNSQGSGEQQPSQLLSAEWKPPSTPTSTAFSALTMSSRTAVSSGASTYTASSRSSSSSAPFSQASSTAFSASTVSSCSTGTTTPSNAPSGSTTAARGQTAFLPLKDHGVTWDHTLDLLLRMDVERDTLDLLSSPLTLTILQAGAEHGHSKTKGASNGHASGTSRFGVVYLDLAQYAGKGEVGRRYLLRDSKTNATLKLSISVTHASGPSEFHAPPLPKGEISNGISEILEENEVYRTRPRGLNLYGPYEDQEELEIDLLGAKAKGKPTASASGTPTTTKHKHSRTISAPTPIFDPERLPHAYGPKTTETLIEALFNPVAVGERRRESPFTVFVDPGAPTTPPPRPPINALGSPGLGMAGMTLRSPGTPPGGGAGAGRGRPMPARSGSGIGAGLGIMGLGMGMGIGMGVGVGVAGGRGSVDARRPSQDGAGRASLSLGHDAKAGDGGRRQASQGAASVWSTGTEASGASADVSVESGSSGGQGQSTLGHERNVSFDSAGGVRKRGVKGWFRKKMGSRPGTPTAGLAY